MSEDSKIHFSKAIKGASWLGLTKLISQVVSWTFTILITRVLSSRDYGLMEMATVFTGYLAFFVEFGIGAALVNKSLVTRRENSSVFWILCSWGLVLFFIAYSLGPVTANFYNEPELKNLTRFAGLLFILTSILIVPRSILQRELRFKEIGLIEAFSTIISCLLMYYFATNSYGYWTLIYGYLSRELLNTSLIILRSKFIPILYLQIEDIKPFIKFGLPVVLSSSLYYIYTKSDRFFGGQYLGSTELGYYAVALQLAAIPVEKIGSIIQSVLYPLLSKVKDNITEFRRFYLSFISLLSVITVPLFIGGFMLADLLIYVLLGEKWNNSIIPFKILLISQLIMILTAPNALINNARGFPKFNLYFNSILTPVMIFGFYLSSKTLELNYLAVPWLIIYPISQLLFTFYTLKSIELSLYSFFKELLPALKGTLIMILILGIIINLSKFYNFDYRNLFGLILLILVGSLTYLLYFLNFNKKLFYELKEVFKEKSIG